MPTPSALAARPYCFRRTLAGSVSDFLASWTQTTAPRGAGGGGATPESAIARGPGELGQAKDELQLVIDNMKAGTLRLPDYLLEMFERATLYFQQIGAAKLPQFKAAPIMELHELAQQVRPPACRLASLNRVWVGAATLCGWWRVAQSSVAPEACARLR